MIKIFGLSEDMDNVEEISTWLESKGITATSFFTDVNESAAEELTTHGFTVHPVLFHQSNRGEVTKLAEGSAIKELTDEAINTIKATVTADVEITELPSPDAINKQPSATTKKV